MSLAGAISGIVFGIIIALIVGIVIGYFIIKRTYDKQLKENPPITEEQIRIMFTQMGRKPSEKQVRQIYHNMKNPKK